MRQGVRLSPYIVTRIRQLIRDGEHVTLVAERMQVTPNTVRRVTNDLRESAHAEKYPSPGRTL
jgi:hypothetical protein